MPKVERIAVFVEHFPPYLGSDRSVFELATRTAKRGVKVHFVATQPLRYLVGHRPDDWAYKENWKTAPPDMGKNITGEYLLLNRYIEALWRRFPPIAYLITLALFTLWGVRALLKHQPDVVVAAHASPIVGAVAFLSARLSLRPLVMGCPDWMTAYAAGLVDESLSSMGPVLLQIAEIMLYRLSERIFAATHFLKNLLISFGIPSEKIAVIPNGVDISRFSPDIDARGIREKYRLGDYCVVLLTGHLEKWAGVEGIFNLVNRLSRDYPESTVLLVGSGEPTSDLLNRLIRQNLGHMIVHAGLHPYSEMPRFVAASDITLCIFPNTLVAHAASPLKIFEYMGAGKAIVATKVAGTAEALDEHTGILVNPGDISGLCDAVVSLCRDRTRRIKLGENARQLAEEKYNWQQLSDRFLAECLKAIRSRF